MASSLPSQMVDPALFDNLQTKIDQDSQVREELRNILQVLDRQGRKTQSILSRAHSTPVKDLSSVVTVAKESINDEAVTIRALAEVASKHPYYKYNSSWTRDVQNTVFSALFCGWLGGYYTAGPGTLLTIEEVGEILGIPVNVTDRDTFHLTIEEYLQALISLIEELARLAVTSVTLGDYSLPLKISQFMKNIQAGFQLLNLKNDSLRRRSDSIKYNVKRVEDVVYDLSLRNLIPRVEETVDGMSDN